MSDTRSSQTQVVQQPVSPSKKKSSFVSIGDLFSQFEVNEGKYISQEFQDFGYRLAVALKDLKHKALYIKMAKEVDRGILERALSFVTDAQHAKSKPRLFMWKVNQLKKERQPQF